MNTPSLASSRRAPTAAFTLIELIVVITIISILMVFTVPAINQAMGANKLTAEGNRLVQELSRAQGEAQRTNRPVQVRFYSFDDPSIPGSEAYYSAFQLFRYQGSDLNATEYTPQNENATALEPMTPVEKLQDPIILAANPTFSSIMNAGEEQGTMPWGKNESLQAKFVAFDSLPSGATNLSGELFAGRQYVFLTLVEQRFDPKGGSAPDNFVCIQIDRFNGSVRQYRP